MRKVSWTIVALLCCAPLWLSGQAKVVTLEQVLAANRMGKLQEEQKQLLQQMGKSLKQTLWHAYIPRASLDGQATYQSDVPNLSIEVPTVPLMPPMDINIPEIPKLQYQAYLQLTQLLWDGGRTASGVRQVDAKSATQIAEVEIAERKSKEALIDLYFALLMVEGQTELLQTQAEEVVRQLDRVNSAHKEGVASDQDRDLVMIEEVKTKQQMSQLKLHRETLIEAIAILTDLDLTGEVQFVAPQAPLLPSMQKHESYLSPDRPEYRLIEAKVAETDAAWALFKAELMPTVALFARGGYGRPGLNLFNSDPDSFGIYGITLKWDFGKLYDWSAQRKIRDRSKQMQKVQKQAFELELLSKEQQLKGEAEQYRQLLEQDQDLIQLYEGMVARAKVEVAEGTNTLSNQLQHQAALNGAKQQAILHQLQYLHALYRLQSHRAELQ